ncbi:MAG: universal stress protein [Acidobacteriota bacterium]
MTTIKRILCPVESSEASQHAFEHALAMARWYQASVSALHVYLPSIAADFTRHPSDDQRLDVVRTRFRADLAAWAGPPGADAIEVEVRFGAGPPVQEILDVAASWPADLIVMGTHGASGFEHLVLGSVTEKVLRKAACPVMTVPPRVHATSALPFKQILCVSDFSATSLAALEQALSLAEESGAGLTLLHVIEWPWDEPPAPLLEELPPEQANALGAFRQRLTRSSLERLERLVPAAVRDRGRIVPKVAHGKSYQAILRVAAEDHADLIVMGVHGRNAVDLTLFGSTTNQVVRRATCPVLTLRR